MLTSKEIKTIREEMKENIPKELIVDCEYTKTISNEEKIALRKKQIEMAMDGNVQMLIWLGKQYLGQQDKQEVEHIRPFDEIEFNGI